MPDASLIWNTVPGADLLYLWLMLRVLAGILEPA